MNARNLVQLFALMLALLTSNAAAQTNLLPLDPGEAVVTCRSGGSFGIGIIDTRDPVCEAPGVVGPTEEATDNWAPPMFHGEGLPTGAWTRSNFNNQELFGLALDDAANPNIYVTASTVYGGTATGQVFRIDGTTGAVSVFATLPNDGPGLGNIAFDRVHRQFYVTNHADGRIYRLDMAGTIVQTVDPFGDDDGAAGYAPLGERLWAIQPDGCHLYFSVWSQYRTNTGTTVGTETNSLWALDIDADGSISGTETRQFTLPSTILHPIADISISGDGNMLLGVRTMTNDNQTLAHQSPALEIVGGFDSWAASPRTFGIGEIGFGGRNSAGGVDYDCAPDDACNDGPHAYLTGDALLFDSRATPPVFAYGLQVMSSLRSGDVRTSYVIDYDVELTTQDKTVQGDVEVYRGGGCLHAPAECTPACTDASDCDDSNDCTTDACTDAGCTNTNVAVGTRCAGGVCDGSAVSMCVPCINDSRDGTDTGCGGATPFCDDSGAVPVCVACEDARHCDDGEECSSDACVAGACINTALPAGTVCSIGVCDGVAGDPKCEECISAAQCDDGNQCTRDLCTLNRCENPAHPVGTSCTGGVCDGMSMCDPCVDNAGPGMTDAGCNATLPACDTSGATNTCVECEVDADCGGDSVCSDDNTCVVCVDTMTGSGLDQGCPASAPICAGASGSGTVGTSCQPCLDDTTGMTDVGCELDGAAGPVCNTTGATNTCVACEDNVAAAAMMDNGCMGDEIICLDPAGGAPSCVECEVDADCTAAGFVCGAANSCVPGCDDNTDCAPTPETPICDTAARECVECLMDSDCLGTESCNLASNSCDQPDSDGDGVPDNDDIDDDNDGIPDTSEIEEGLEGDSDNDGVLDFQDPDSVTCEDSDANGICDSAATEVDFDGDGIPNHLDLDADDDGITDANEGGAAGAEDPDLDGNGIIDGFADADGNGLSDNVQAAPLPLPNTDGEEGPDFLDLDSDDDTLPDATEGHDNDHDGTPENEAAGADTDGDGIDDAFDPDCVDVVCAGIVGVIAPTPDFDEDGADNYRDIDDDDDGLDTATEVQDALDYDADGIGEAPDGSDVDGDGPRNWYDVDADDDGAEDDVEDSRDSGGDGDLNDNGVLDYLEPDFTPMDTDMDGVPDSIECTTLPDLDSCEDSDGDGSPDYNDVDDDNDGVLTLDEGNNDSDGDGLPNRIDIDADNDGIPDLWENGGKPLDLDEDGIADDDTDSSGNGLFDVYGEPESPTNTDGDSVPDMLDLDADGDGLLDIYEADGTDADGDGIVDDISDMDGDGLADLVDPDNGGTPWGVPDTDDDGAMDFQDVDSDADGAPDATEGWDGDHNGVADVLPLGTDEDGNGVDDAYDAEAPALPDTDEDGMVDWRDTDDDNDGVLTEYEGPTAQDTDADGTPDYLDVDDDGDGIDTIDESPDANGDGNPDDALDSDEDGTPDYLDVDGGSTEGGYSGGAFGCSTGNTQGGLTLLSLLGMVTLFGRRRRRL